jgi:RNA polymerase sigma-70 factor (ECF subfamily)
MGLADGERSDAEIFRSLYPALRRFAAAVRAPGSDADDLVQEALARTLAARSLASIDQPLAYLRTAVMRIAINATRSSRRETQRIARATAADDDTVDTYPSDLDALRALPPMTRAVLYLTVLEGHSYREAAAIVGCNEAAARQAASRGLARLRHELTDERSIGERT